MVPTTGEGKQQLLLNSTLKIHHFRNYQHLCYLLYLGNYTIQLFRDCFSAIIILIPFFTTK